MANFPMGIIPTTWNLDNTTAILCNGGRLIIRSDGEMALEGSVKDAALGLIKYVVDRQCVPGLQEIQINKGLSIHYENGLSIEYIGPKKPEFWDDLSREFNRVAKMKAFW